MSSSVKHRNEALVKDLYPHQKRCIKAMDYNGEMIISESSERYEMVKTYIEELGMHIKIDEYGETKKVVLYPRDERIVKNNIYT